MNQYIKTTGEKLIRQFDLVLQAFLFFISPAIILYLVVINRPGENFALNIFYYIGLVYVSGGFLILGLKLLEIYDYGFVIFKRRQWKADPLLKKVHYKVCIPKGFNKKPVDMMTFYYDMRNLVGGTRTKHEVYNLGKWYYDWVFDIIVRNGKLEIYMTFPFKRIDFIMKTFATKFPEIKLVQTKDPYEKWPTKWEPGKTNLAQYEAFHAFDFQMPKVLGPQNLKFAEDLGDANPITELLESFMKFDPNVMFVWQYVFRPFPLPKAKSESWYKELKQIKSEILGRSNTFTYKNPEGNMMTGMSGDLITDAIKRKINRMEQKLSEPFFRTHLKLMIFYPKGKKYYGPIVEKLAKAFAGQIYDGVTIEKNWFSANDRLFLETNSGMFDSVLAPVMDRLYHAKENIYRAKVQFEELAGRDPDVSNDSMDFMISVPEVSSLWHWPHIATFPEEFKPGEGIEQKEEEVIEIKKDQQGNTQVKITNEKSQEQIAPINQTLNINRNQNPNSTPNIKPNNIAVQINNKVNSENVSFNKLQQLRERNRTISNNS